MLVAWPAMRGDPTTEPATAETTQRLLSSSAGGPTKRGQGGRGQRPGGHSPESTTRALSHLAGVTLWLCQNRCRLLEPPGTCPGLAEGVRVCGGGFRRPKEKQGARRCHPWAIRTHLQRCSPEPRSSGGVHRTARDTEEAMSPPARTAEGGPSSSQPEEG